MSHLFGVSLARGVRKTDILRVLRPATKNFPTWCGSPRVAWNFPAQPYSILKFSDLPPFLFTDLWLAGE